MPVKKVPKLLALTLDFGGDTAPRVCHVKATFGALATAIPLGSPQIVVYMSDQAVQKEIRGRFVQNDNEVVAKLQILMGKVVSFPLARLEVKQLYIHVPRHETKRIIFLKQSYFH